jgi:2-iminobutanoate/2-iminopropanoate deaminase
MKQVIYPEGWKPNRGFYSPAIQIDVGTGYMIYVSGQQIIKNEKGEALTDDIAEQTEYVFQALEKTLNTAGASLDDVIKAQIFLTDMKDFEVVSNIRAKYFANSKPVSTLLEVNGMTVKGAKIEIEVTAYKEKTS